MIGEYNIEMKISSQNAFGIFGSNNPNTIASIVYHEWFEVFEGKVYAS